MFCEHMFAFCHRKTLFLQRSSNYNRNHIAHKCSINFLLKTTCFSYERVLREKGAYQDKAVYVEDTEAAVRFLEDTKGNILLTTGSKELGKFTALSDAGERIYARVLSLPSVMETCKGYGFEGKHLIGIHTPPAVPAPGWNLPCAWPQ